MTTLEEVRARFARGQGLPFADALTELSILDALEEHGVKYRDRLFSPITTIWGFLSQVLSEDHSCRDTVSRIIAHRAAAGPAASPPPGCARWPGGRPGSCRPASPKAGSGTAGPSSSPTAPTSPCPTRQR